MLTTQQQNQKMITQHIWDVEKQGGFPSITWNGGSYGCVFVDNSKLEVLKHGGFDLDIPIRLTVRKYAYQDGQLIALFPTDPQPNDEVILLNGLYFIKTITTDFTNSFYLVELKRKKRV